MEGLLMRTLTLVICLVLTVLVVSLEAVAQRRRPLPPIDRTASANLYEVFGKLKAVAPDGSAFTVDLFEPPKVNDITETALFKITGETIFRSLEEGKTLKDYPPGTRFVIAYKSTGATDCKGTAMLVRRILRPLPGDPAPKTD
jgi:hypothetical protein